MEPSLYVRVMLQILPAFHDETVVSGTTLVDTSALPWPGASFGVAASANADHVERSFGLLAQTLQVPRESIRSVRQVHGITIQPFANSTDDAEGDALIASRPGEIVGVKIADCCAILIHDPVKRIVAAVHSGWRGTAAGILPATLERLVSDHHCIPEELRLYLSACASGARYEVGEDVAALLPAYCSPLTNRPGKWLFDNHAALADQARSRGVLHTNISLEGACTIVDARFHSYRRDKERSGRCFAFIGLREIP